METTRSQRWRERRSRFVDDLEVIDPNAYAVDVIEHPAARAFIAEHHYLPTYPAAQVAVGLFATRPRPVLAGVAVFAVPSTGAVVTAHSGLATAAQGCVLARLLLLDSVPQNGESYFVARALRLLRRERPAIEAVVSFSDPSAGHIGRVYAALSSAYRGRTSERLVLMAGRRTVSDRTLSKIRGGERGHGGAIDQLVALGLPRPAVGEEPAAWLARLRHERHLVARRRPGLFTYCFELTRHARRAGRSLPRLTYPKILPDVPPTLPFEAGR